MKNIIMSFLCVFVSSVSSISFASDTINILTTTADLKSIAESVGGDLVSVTSLGNGNQNYHFLAAKPSFMLKARQADLFIVNGLELEVGYESLILEGSRNPKIQKGRPGYLDASAGIQPLEIPEHVDRSMGDIHASGNPHYWLDPENAKIIARSMAKRFGELLPAGSNSFDQNLLAFETLIDQKTAQWTAELSPYQGEGLVSFHSSWSYFARRFGFEVIGQLEPKPGIPPTPSHLQEVIADVQRKNVKVILNESIYPDDAARFVAGKTGARVVVAPVSVGGDPQAKDYVSLIDGIVKKLVEGFEE